MPISIGSSGGVATLVPPIGAATARNPDPGFQAAKARTSDLVAQAKQDAERQPLSVTDPVEVERSVDSAVDAIAVKLDEKRAAAGLQLPGRSGSGGRIDLRV